MPAGKKILVVDDEENIAILVKNILESEGFEVSTANNGNECIDAVAKKKPDLVLLDIMMPGMTGVETAGKIRSNKKTRSTKIIFLTVVIKKELKQSILEKLNITDYIIKPFDNADLIMRVRRALGQPRA